MTQALLNLAEREWASFDGWCASRNVAPLELPPARCLSLIYYWATRYADEKQQARFDMRLWIPPPAEAGKAIEEGPWSAEAEKSAFNAFASDVGVTVGDGGTMTESA